MSRYELIHADDNGSKNILLLIDGKVVSRWAELNDDEEFSDLSAWDNQAEAGADLSDYQADLDAGRFRVSVIAAESATNPNKASAAYRCIGQHESPDEALFHAVKMLVGSQKMRHQFRKRMGSMYCNETNSWIDTNLVHDIIEAYQAAKASRQEIEEAAQ